MAYNKGELIMFGFGKSHKEKFEQKEAKKLAAQKQQMLCNNCGSPCEEDAERIGALAKAGSIITIGGAGVTLGAYAVIRITSWIIGVPLSLADNILFGFIGTCGGLLTMTSLSEDIVRTADSIGNFVERNVFKRRRNKCFTMEQLKQNQNQNQK
jgi:hypothetical protein